MIILSAKFGDPAHRENYIKNNSFYNSQAPYRPFRALSLKEGKDLENNNHRKIFSFTLLMRGTGSQNPVPIVYGT